MFTCVAILFPSLKQMHFLRRVFWQQAPPDFTTTRSAHLPPPFSNDDDLTILHGEKISTVLANVTPFSLVEFCRRFETTLLLVIRCQIWRHKGSTFFRTVCELLPDYTTAECIAQPSRCWEHHISRRERDVTLLYGDGVPLFLRNPLRQCRKVILFGKKTATSVC
jgi:hypothetical protein